MSKTAQERAKTARNLATRKEAERLLIAGQLRHQEISERTGVSMKTLGRYRKALHLNPNTARLLAKRYPYRIVQRDAAPQTATSTDQT